MSQKYSVKEIENLWNELHPKVYGYFYKRLNNKQDVEDLTSSTMYKFLDKLSDSKTDIKHMYGYLWRMAYNEFLNLIASKNKQEVAVSFGPDFDFSLESVDNFTSQHYSTRVDALLSCLQKGLKEDEYELVKSIYLEEKKSTEIAAESGQKAPTIRKRLERILKKARQKCLELWKNSTL